ncbi:MAG: 4-aminobutyrate--2-oxoglutarate transaminase [Actinomycetota bacterium]|nr:4-aminobutyrate--2-oxoglutarate transaminase [Actinomycetota bacterium]
MSVRESTQSERIAADRMRYVAPGVSTPRLIVAYAEGARITDVDGRSFIDFAGGIGCQNLGHRHPAVVDAVKDQAERFLHQCFVVGTYEPYVEVCRRLGELSPCGAGEQRSLLVNAGAEAVENAVKIARAATGRPAVVVFEYAFHGRTLLAMTMTSKVKPYKAGFGPFAPEVYRVPAPYPYRGVSSDDAIAALEHLFKANVDPSTVACVVLEPVQGEGGFIPMPPDYLRRLQEICRSHGILYVDDEIQTGVGRTGKMWAVEHHDGVEPDLLISGKSIGGGLPLAAVTGRAEIMDAVPAGGLGGTFGGNPLSCAAALAVLDIVSDESFLTRARKQGELLRARLEELADRHSDIGEVRGLGPMLAFEFADRSPERAQAVVSAAFDRGLVLLSCGLYGNVIRLLPPLTIGEEDLEGGLAILEESLAA